jgi:hypothetical protein
MGYLLSLLALGVVAAQQPASSTPLVDLDQARIREFRKIQDVRSKILASDPFASTDVNALRTDPVLRDMGLDGPNGTQQIEEALGYRFDTGVYQGFHPVDMTAKDDILNCAIPRTDATGAPKFVTLKDGYKDVPLAVYKVKLVYTPHTTAPGQPPLSPKTQEIYIGILNKQDLEATLKYNTDHQSPRMQYSVAATIVPDSGIPVQLYENSARKVLAVLSKEPSQPLIFPDRPELLLFRNTPDEVTTAFKTNNRGGLRVQEVEWGFNTSEGIVGLEHIRRKAYLALQKLKADILAKNPTTADFPPEMLQTPEFKATGLDITSQHDNVVFREAMLYKPEGERMSDYHPIDFTKDKAANFTAATMADSSSFSIKSVKDTFSGQNLFLFKVEQVASDPKQPQTAQEFYVGPMTQDTLESLEKSITTVKVTQVKGAEIPIQVYTNDAGRLAFVLTVVPKDLLMIPTQPTVVVATDPVDAVKPILSFGKNPTPQQQAEARQQMQKLHQVQVEYALPDK